MPAAQPRRKNLINYTGGGEGNISVDDREPGQAPGVFYWTIARTSVDEEGRLVRAQKRYIPHERPIEACCRCNMALCKIEVERVSLVDLWIFRGGSRGSNFHWRNWHSSSRNCRRFMGMGRSRLHRIINWQPSGHLERQSSASQRGRPMRRPSFCYSLLWINDDQTDDLRNHPRTVDSPHANVIVSTTPLDEFSIFSMKPACSAIFIHP
jgi:hypothetical protein